MLSLTTRVSLLLLGSGFCALVYQVTWFRMFRLVFGASTAASAAVLGIFMAGLGFGGLYLGKKADKSKTPLKMYAHLELGVSLGAAATPLLIALIRWIYIEAGGSSAMGLTLSTVVRLVLSALVLALPTFLMGGTLPAVARAVEKSTDQGRRKLGMLYGANTTGAVLGALFATFVALEILGTNRTLWCACLLNLIVVFVARIMARRLPPVPIDEKPEVKEKSEAKEKPKAKEKTLPGQRIHVPARLVLIAAALVGFAFFLMELVWYRMLAPVLGGSSYTFGLVLCVALAGIGVGGWLYGVSSSKTRPTLNAFALTCVLEALFLVIPLALGDKIAVLAIILRPLGDIGFWPLVTSWSVVTIIVAFVPAAIAGYQFPLLVSLMGEGSRDVGKQVGLVYAWNTIGAIVGSLAGGFGFLPLLTAPGAWRAVTIMLVLLGFLSLLVVIRQKGFEFKTLAPLAISAIAILLCFTQGPTAAWRHTPIGAGRIRASSWTENELRRTLNAHRRGIVWEQEGVESSVAMSDSNGNNVLVNGKSDSNIRFDGSTVVMSGLLAALLHTEPRRALVIGLGTGGTAGWLAEVDSIEQVDVVELEAAVAGVARDCAAANHNVLEHPKVNLIIADGHEFARTTEHRYDVIVSEPSNPYRAGISSFFTQEFYESISERLTDEGIFVQWLQSYEVDARTVRTVYATLGSVFPAVETWEVNVFDDLLLFARNREVTHDVARIRRVVETEPYRTAMANTWGVVGVEGVFSAFVATPEFARAVYERDQEFINTEDMTLVEFQFARTVGRSGLMSMETLRQLVRSRGEDRPDIRGGGIDWSMASEYRTARSIAEYGQIVETATTDQAQLQRIQARVHYSEGDFAQAHESWTAQTGEPVVPIDIVMVGELYAEAGDERALELARSIRPLQPSVSESIIAQYYYAKGDMERTVRHLVRCLRQLRTDAWTFDRPISHALDMMPRIAEENHDHGRTLYRELGRPFAVGLFTEYRLMIRLQIAEIIDFEGLCLEAFQPFEPYVPWTRGFLARRAQCYEVHEHDLSRRAILELGAFLRHAPPSLTEGLERPQTDSD